MKLDDLLQKVCDKETFIVFVKALAEERVGAKRTEEENRDNFVIDCASNWKNSDIASFLYAALDYFEEKPLHKPEQEPGWRMFAEFLYFGKITE
ncbi:MAG: hypothetical protein J2P41_01825 [Blastocatellia bacterium]|nr:hypothetical protein [Blastocatellia bacterium]